jgi:hypothetical protein
MEEEDTHFKMPSANEIEIITFFGVYSTSAVNCLPLTLTRQASYLDPLTDLGQMSHQISGPCPN